VFMSYLCSCLILLCSVLICLVLPCLSCLALSGIFSSYLILSCCGWVEGLERERLDELEGLKGLGVGG
jgi:hypothetical protein